MNNWVGKYNEKNDSSDVCHFGYGSINQMVIRIDRWQSDANSCLRICKGLTIPLLVPESCVKYLTNNVNEMSLVFDVAQNERIGSKSDLKSWL